MYPEGHTFQRTDPAGATHVYFCQPYPWVRCVATVEGLKDPAHYEGYTCLAPGATRAGPAAGPGRRGASCPGWKARTPPLDFETQKKLIEAGSLSADEAPLRLKNVETGEEVRVSWGGRGLERLSQPVGLRVRGDVRRDVVAGGGLLRRGRCAGGAVDRGSQDRHARQVHVLQPPAPPVFRPGRWRRLIYFEGTYSRTFSGNPVATPRYDYNQVMYRLDLADPRLGLPAPGVKK